MKSVGEGYTEVEIKKLIAEKPERRAEEKATPTMLPPLPSTPLAEKPKTIKPLIDISGNPKFTES